MSLLASCATGTKAPDRAVLVVHGGAGTITRATMTPALEAQYRDALSAALRAGHDVLRQEGSSLDAVVATLVMLEDSPLFNAGVGAVFTADETVELDASIMSGSTRNAGAVAGVRTLAHPIRVARAVMERSEHVMLVGAGAERFAASVGAEIVPNSYFHTERRLQQLRDKRGSPSARADLDDPPLDEHRFGTVGAVALDVHGHLAAGTSTGGMTDKRFGRVGDSPIIGAGTWADDATCGVSATGHGEYFIRAGIAQDIASRMAYQGLDVQAASNAVIHGTLTGMGGTGGVIVLDAQGHMATPFNTEGMYRGWVDTEGNVTVEIYGNE